MKGGLATIQLRPYKADPIFSPTERRDHHGSAQVAETDRLWEHRKHSDPFAIRRSPIQGVGAFATRQIPRGTRLIEYCGEILTSAEADERYPDVTDERHHTYLFAIDDDVVIDAAVGGNDARFINHSCDPNCDAVIDGGRIWIETIRDVGPGEELAYDYAYILDELHTPAAKRRFPCTCGSKVCRGTILGKKK